MAAHAKAMHRHEARCIKVRARESSKLLVAGIMRESKANADLEEGS